MLLKSVKRREVQQSTAERRIRGRRGSRVVSLASSSRDNDGIVVTRRLARLRKRMKRRIARVSHTEPVVHPSNPAIESEYRRDAFASYRAAAIFLPRHIPAFAQ